MAIVPFPTCKLHAHNYIPNIFGGRGPSRVDTSLQLVKPVIFYILIIHDKNTILELCSMSLNMCDD